MPPPHRVERFADRRPPTAPASATHNRPCNRPTIPAPPHGHRTGCARDASRRPPTDERRTRPDAVQHARHRQHKAAMAVAAADGSPATKGGRCRRRRARRPNQPATVAVATADGSPAPKSGRCRRRRARSPKQPATVAVATADGSPAPKGGRCCRTRAGSPRQPAKEALATQSVVRPPTAVRASSASRPLTPPCGRH